MRRAFVGTLAFSMVFLALCALAGDKKTSPPQSNAFGKSLAEWMELYFQWNSGLSEQADHVGHVQFLAMPDGKQTSDEPVTYTGHLDTMLKPGEPFVLPVVVWIGETYEDGHIDLPLDPSDFFGVFVTLDGKPMIDSDVDDLSNWYFPPTNFDPPIVYPEPTSSGSTGWAYVQGIGFVHPPLPVGKHTLTLYSEVYAEPLDLVVAYANTWTITVKR